MSKITLEELEGIIFDAVADISRIDRSKVTPDINLYHDLELDSLDAQGLATSIESRLTAYGFNADAAGLAEAISVSDLIERSRNYLNLKNPTAP
jgi:acyl carrier protein